MAYVNRKRFRSQQSSRTSNGADRKHGRRFSLFWSTFFEGTAKNHMLVLVPVKARNSIDITLRRETTKTRATTTPSNSLKLSFTDVVGSSLGADGATRRPLRNGDKKCRD